MTFWSPCIKGTYAYNFINVDVDLNCLDEVMFFSFSAPQSDSFLFPSPYCTLWKKASMHNPNYGVGSYASPP